MSTKKITLSDGFNGVSKQSKFTPDDIKEKVKDYKKIQATHWDLIKAGDMVRYFSSGKSADKKHSTFKMGGIVKQNMYPKYLVIANYYKNLSWCVQYTDPNLIIYLKSLEIINKERKQKEKTWTLFKTGKLVPKQLS